MRSLIGIGRERHGNPADVLPKMRAGEPVSYREITMTDVTTLEGARAAKRLGLPLTTPCETGEVSETVARHWHAVGEAYAAYEKARDRYVAKQSPARFRKITVELNHFHQAALAADTYLGKVKGENDGFGADRSAVLLIEMCSRADAIYFWWYDRINLVNETGQPVTFDLAECPTFFDGEVA